MHHVPNLRIIRTYRVRAFAEHFKDLTEDQFVRSSVFGTAGEGLHLKGEADEEILLRSGARKPSSQDFCEAQIYDGCESSTKCPASNGSYS